MSESRMNPRVKNLWTDRLNSEHVEQGTYTLRPSDDTRCCLGVLCDLYEEEMGITWNQDDGDWIFLGCSSALPNEVVEWAGLGKNEQPYNPIVAGRTLASLNDSNRLTFPEIAALIDKHL